MDQSCQLDDAALNVTKKNHIQALESKLSRIRGSKNTVSAASMITSLKMAKEDSARGLISGTISAPAGQNDEQYTFLDKLYASNTVYRHMFPETQSLGTSEKACLVKNDELSRLKEEDTDE